MAEITADEDMLHAHAHQFDSSEQQFGASMFGMWSFLATEVMTFGGLFLGYIVFRWQYPTAFHIASFAQNVTLGAINTAVLITSSFTMAMAVRSAQLGKRNLVNLFILLTMLGAFTFLGIKAVEYTNHWQEHLFPGSSFHYAPEEHIPAGDNISPVGIPQSHYMLFFSFYWMMTALHGLHVLIGIGVMAYLLFINNITRRINPEYYTPVEVAGLYWHFVDIVWIFLFPLLYLIGGVKP